MRHYFDLGLLVTVTTDVPTRSFIPFAVFPLEIPPLREPPEDIAPLAAHFIRLSARRMNRPEPAITEAALSQLTSYDWPGNVRQLQNVIERGIILWQEGPLTFDVPASDQMSNFVQCAKPGTRTALSMREQLKRHERDAIAAALKQTNGKVFGPGGAAELLVMKPTTLASRMSALGPNRKAAIRMGGAAPVGFLAIPPAG